VSPIARNVFLAGASLLVLGIALVHWFSTPYYLGAATIGTRAVFVVEDRGSSAGSRSRTFAVEVTDPQACSSGSGLARVLGTWNASSAKFEPTAGEISCSSLRVLPGDALATVMQRAGHVTSSEVGVPPRRPCAADPSCASYPFGIALGLHLKYSDSIIQTRLDSSGNRRGTESVCAYSLDGGAVHVIYFLDHEYAFEHWPDF
jgi:hypothetical protein